MRQDRLKLEAARQPLNEAAQATAAPTKPPSPLALALKAGAAKHHELKRARATSDLDTTASSKASSQVRSPALPSPIPASAALNPAALIMAASGPASAKLPGAGSAADTSVEKINTSTHKVAWSKLERLMNSGKAAEFPHMASLFNGRQSDTKL